MWEQKVHIDMLELKEEREDDKEGEKVVLNVQMVRMSKLLGMSSHLKILVKIHSWLGGVCAGLVVWVQAAIKWHTGAGVVFSLIMFSF